jgi:hypothetical protein
MRKTAVERLLPLLVCVAIMSVIAGCGGEPFKMVPVSGKVTYADGTLIPGDQIVLRFHPEDAKAEGMKVLGFANGDVNPQDGTYSLTTHTANDGAVPGKYKVTLIATKNVDGMPTPSPAVAQKYQAKETTPLKFEVTGPTKEANFLNIEKPGKK